MDLLHIFQVDYSVLRFYSNKWFSSCDRKEATISNSQTAKEYSIQ